MGKVQIGFAVDAKADTHFRAECKKLGTTPGAVLNDLMGRFDAEEYRRMVDGKVPSRRGGRRKGQKDGVFKADGSLRLPRPGKGT